MIGVPIAKMGLKKQILIGCITRNGATFIPKGNDQIEAGDSIIVVTTKLGMKDAESIINQ